MLAELELHPHARAVLGPALEVGSTASHAYLFYGPGGSGKRSVARAMAAELLAAGSPDPTSARMRAMSGAHPDLTWVAPSGAHEMLVSDIDGPVVSAASKTPFEASCRVFVIEHVDELGDEAANRMLKTLEEPASFVHLILLTSARSRCCRRSARAASWCASTRRRSTRSRAEVEAAGVDRDTALACARLSLGDAEQASELAGEEGGRSAPPRSSSRAQRWRANASGASRGPTCSQRCGPGATRRARSSRPGPPPSSSSTPVRSESGSRPSGPSAPGGSGGGSRPAHSTSRSSSCRCGSPTSPASPGGRTSWCATRSAGRAAGRCQGSMRPRCAAPSSWSRTPGPVCTQRLRGACVRSARLPPGTALAL